MIAGIWGLLVVLFVILWFGSELPDLQELAFLPRKPSVTILDRKGKVLATYGDCYGHPVEAKDLPRHLIQALLAIEDHRFFQHWGLDPIGIARAFLRNIQRRGVKEGGSTLTQQLAKNFLQTKKMYAVTDRSFKRKISEAILAIRIEMRFTKEEILTMYLNRMYFGSGTWGIDAAAKKYFGRSAKNLGLYESSMLIGLLQAPSRYSPAANHERSEIRGQKVLNAMVRQGFIKPNAALAAMALPVPISSSLKNPAPRYFTDWIMDRLQEEFSLPAEDLIVTSTLDSNFQKIAELQAQRVIKTLGPQWNAHQMALVNIDLDGAVRAMIGGISYPQSVFNRATKALRQAGSIFKYFVYLSALEAGYRKDSMVDDSPVQLRGWKAKNFKYENQGVVSLEKAFAKSVNSVSIRLLMALGLPKVIEMARRMGIKSPIPKSARNYTLALGTNGVHLLEMTSAFGVVANGGYAVCPYGIEKIATAKGNVLFEVKDKKTLAKRILMPEIVSEMKKLLRAVTAYGTGRYAVLTQFPHIPIFGKSGTSNKGLKDRDSWFIGFTPESVTGIWVGNDDEAPMNRPEKPGGSLPVRIFRLFNTAKEIYSGNPDDPQWKEKDYSTLSSLNLPLESQALLPQGSLNTEDEDEDEDEDDETSSPSEKESEDEDENGEENERP